MGQKYVESNQVLSLSLKHGGKIGSKLESGIER